jgi:hypothetical protein
MLSLSHNSIAFLCSFFLCESTGEYKRSNFESFYSSSTEIEFDEIRTNKVNGKRWKKGGEILARKTRTALSIKPILKAVRMDHAYSSQN